MTQEFGVNKGGEGGRGCGRHLDSEHGYNFHSINKAGYIDGLGSPQRKNLGVSMKEKSKKSSGARWAGSK